MIVQISWGIWAPIFFIDLGSVQRSFCFSHCFELLSFFLDWKTRDMTLEIFQFFFQLVNVQQVGDVAVDWVAQRLYWTDSSAGTIESSGLDGSSRRTIVKDNLQVPHAVKVDPESKWVARLGKQNIVFYHRHWTAPWMQFIDVHFMRTFHKRGPVLPTWSHSFFFIWCHVCSSDIWMESPLQKWV